MNDAEKHADAIKAATAAAYRKAADLFEDGFWARWELHRMATAIDGIASDGFPVGARLFPPRGPDERGADYASCRLLEDRVERLEALVASLLEPPRKSPMGLAIPSEDGDPDPEPLV
jgi:hypothetical protein